MVDFPTLLFASFTARLGFIVIFLIASWKSEARSAFQLWTASIVASMIGMLLMYSDPDFPYYAPGRGTLTFAVLGLSVAWLWAGGRAFFQRPVSKARFSLMAFGPGAIYGAAHSVGWAPDVVVMLTILSFIGSCAVASGSFFLRYEARRLPSQVLVGSALAFYSLALVASAALIGATILWPQAGFGHQTTNISLSLLVDQSMSVLIYVGLVAMSLEDVQLRMSKLATTDSLTGLANRRGVQERAMPLIGSGLRGKRPMAVLIVDIDHFKSINDRFGHDGGDRVLREFARRLGAHCQRKQDVTGRWGGEEFLAVLCDMTLEQAARFAERLCVAIARDPFDIGHRTIAVTVSIGVAPLVDTISPLDQAVRAADRALYDAKHHGRNRVHTTAPAGGVNASSAVTTGEGSLTMS